MATRLDPWAPVWRVEVIRDEAPARAARTSAIFRHGSLTAILALGIVCALDAGIVSALITPLKADLALNDEAFGRIAATFTAAALLGAPVFGFLSGRFGRKPALIVGALLWSLASSGGALASGVIGLALWRGLTGFGEAAYQGLAPGWISDLYAPRWRNFVFSLFMVRNKFGTAIALALGAWLAANYSWQAAFLISGVPGLVLVLVLLFLKEPTPGISDGAPVVSRPLSVAEQLAVLRIPPYTAHIFAVSLFYAGTLTAQMWAPAFLHRQYGLTNQAASGFLAIVLFMTTPVGLIGGYVFGRFLGPFRAGLSAALAATSLLTAISFSIAFLTSDLATAKIAIVIAIVAMGSTAGSLASLVVEFVPALLRSAAGSIGAFFNAALSGAGAPWLLGALSDRYGLARAIFVGPVSYALAAIIWTVMAIALARSSTPSLTDAQQL